ncbi:MAG: hypothetical protein ACKVQS_09950 [Fimbriimonadaceae bacterium]
MSSKLQIIKETTSESARITQVVIHPDDEHNRRDCPQIQSWLIKSGSWMIENKQDQSQITPGSFTTFQPFQPSKRRRAIY